MKAGKLGTEENKLLTVMMSKTVIDVWNDFSEGNADKKAEMIGKAVGEIIFMVAGTKGVGEATKALKASTETGKLSEVISKFSKGTVTANDIDKIDVPPVVKGASNAETSIISDETRDKILEGQRKNPNKNELIGGHSPEITNSNLDYAVEDISINADGTRKVKFTTEFSDGNLAKIKTSTLFPDTWSEDKIINSIKTVGDTPSIGVRARDGATLYRDIIDGVQIEVIKEGNIVTSGYPTGGGVSELLAGFQ